MKAAATLIGLLFLAAACGPYSGSSKAGPSPRLQTATAVPFDGPLVADLLKLNEFTPATIVFDWLEGDERYRLGPGLFVWRETESVRRWDEEHTGKVDPGVGHILLSTRASEVYCVWVLAPDLSDISFGCERELGAPTGAIPGMKAAMQARIVGRLPNQNIAGRNATCFHVEATNAETGAICVDEDLNKPLLVSMPNPHTGVTQRLVAKSVDVSNEQLLDVPHTVPADIVSLESLRLPGVYEFSR